MAADDRQCRLVLQSGDKGVTAAPAAANLLDKVASAADATVADATHAADGQTTENFHTAGVPLAFPSLDDPLDYSPSPGGEDEDVDDPTPVLEASTGAGRDDPRASQALTAKPNSASTSAAKAQPEQSFNPFGLSETTAPMPEAQSTRGQQATADAFNPFGSPPPQPVKKSPASTPGSSRRRSLPPLPQNVLAAHEAPVVNHANGKIDFSFQGATDNSEKSAAINHSGGRQFVLTPEEEEDWENCDSSV